MFILSLVDIYPVKLSICVFVNSTNITSPLVFKLCDTQGYLWLSYDLTDVINLTGNIQVKKMLYYSFSIIVLNEILVGSLTIFTP